ncbi:molybdate ABC transporter substrate-binding protein [Marinomonas epiphytica]
MSAFDLTMQFWHFNKTLFNNALALVIGLCLSHVALAADIRVGVASNFITPMQYIKQAFEEQSNHTLSLSFASTGKLYAQIKHGAPYDAFFSADYNTSARLIKEQLAQSESLFTYATGQLAILSILPEQDISSLLKQSKHIAIANPKLAPYGQASQQLLTKLDLWQPNQKKLVLGENVAQALHFILTKNAQTGFVALSQALSVEQQRTALGINMLILPQALYDKVQQTAVILNSSQHQQAVRELFAFIQQPKIQQAISEFGYASK